MWIPYHNLDSRIIQLVSESLIYIKISQILQFLSKFSFDLQPGYMEADSNPNTSKLWRWDLLRFAISKEEGEKEKIYLYKFRQSCKSVYVFCRHRNRDRRWFTLCTKNLILSDLGFPVYLVYQSPLSAWGTKPFLLLH